jgi:hypothetical protein
MSLQEILNAGWPAIKSWKGEPYQFYQSKMDGRGIKVIKGEDNGFFIEGCGKWKWERHEMLQNRAAQRLNEILPASTVLLAELWYPEHKATDVISGTKDPNAELMFSIFAIPLIGGNTYTDFYGNYLRKLEDNEPLSQFDVAEVWHQQIIDKYTALKDYILPLEPAVDWLATVDEVIEWMHNEARDRKIEGFVLKQHYLDKWYKVKPVATCDCFVIDYDISESYQRKGLIEALTVAIYHNGAEQQVARVGNGWSTYEREELTKEIDSDWSKIKGRTMEVAYDSLTVGEQGYTEGAQLRFPRFVRWRDDKSAEKCTSQQF